jgi:hypothetical protein
MTIDYRLKVVLGLLNCRDESKPNTQMAIVLIQRHNDVYGQFYHRGSQPLSVPTNFHQGAKRESIYITNDPESPNGYQNRFDYSDLWHLGYKFNSLYPPGKVYITQESVESTGDRPGAPSVLLFTVTDERPNIAVLGSLAKPLIALTDSSSVIEFLLKKKGRDYNNPYPDPSMAPIWSSHIDFDELRTRDCWSHDVDISVPQSLPGQTKLIRLSARFNLYTLKISAKPVVISSSS